MDNSAVQYVGFIVAVLILIWGVIEINRRYFRRGKMGARPLNTWVPLDASQPDAPEDGPPATDNDTMDSSEQNMQTRARQNGHYSESKRAF